MNAKVREVPVRFHSTGGTFTLIARASPDGTAPAAEAEAKTIATGGVAYTGQVLHSMFGDVIADLKGLAPINARGIALLYGHYTPVGVVRSVSETERGLEYSGEMVKGLEKSNEIAALAASGFPWQLSIRAEPDVIEELGAKATAEVNGQTVTGPITIFRQWRLPEISIVELGMDGDTEATIAAHAGGGVRRRVLLASPAGRDEMADTDTATAPTTVEELRASSPDLVAAIEAEATAQGVSAERARITEIIDATRQAIAGEPADGATPEPNVEAQALDLIVTATKDGKAAHTLMASLLKLSRASVKATAAPATPQEARRAVTAAATAVESGTDEAATTGSTTASSGPVGSLMASASNDWGRMSATQRAATKCIDEDAYVGERLLAAKGK
jgi:hypothetical protein